MSAGGAGLPQVAEKATMLLRVRVMEKLSGAKYEQQEQRPQALCVPPVHGRRAVF